MRVLLFLHRLVGPSPGALNTGIRANLILTQMPTTQRQPPCWSILHYFPWLWEFSSQLTFSEDLVCSSCPGSSTRADQLHLRALGDLVSFKPISYELFLNRPA